MWLSCILCARTQVQSSKSEQSSFFSERSALILHYKLNSIENQLCMLWSPDPSNLVRVRETINVCVERANFVFLQLAKAREGRGAVVTLYGIVEVVNGCNYLHEL